MKTNTTNIAVTAIGAAVTGLGYGLMRRSMRSKFAPGLLGFGLAHVALGVLDMNRTKADTDFISFDME